MDEKGIKNLKNIPVYPYSFLYARGNGEEKRFRESREANRECRKAIDAVFDAAWDGTRPPAEAAKSILDRFGQERVVYVLADELQQRRGDGRFSQTNQDWAQSVPMFMGAERRWDGRLNCHSAKLDGFVTMIRREADVTSIIAARTEALKAIPVYRHSIKYAAENKESVRFFASHEANIACKEAVEAAIARNFRDNRLNSDGAQQVVARFGFDRTLFVLANTVRHQEWDGRISDANREWAKTQPVFDTKDNLGRDMSADYVVDGAGSPGLTSLFLDQVREAYALEQKQTRETQTQETEINPESREKQSQTREAKNNKKETACKVPFYPETADWARDHGETELYGASRKANEACRAAIDKAIAEHFHHSCLSAEGAKSVLREFGPERVSFVLAHTMRINSHDGRYSERNREWASQVKGYEMYNPFDLVCRSHPALLDLFIDQTREEILIHTPLSRNEIKAEARSILTRFQQAREPNTPDGTHFAVQVSEEFMKRAKPKDMERLSGMLPFASLALSAISDRKGTFAIISRDENRNQKLILRKPSIRQQLAEKAPEKEAAAPKARTKEASL